MNILIPMAGAGSRFQQAGYTLPKPLIDVEGKPMIERVVENLGFDGKYIFIVQKSHFDTYALDETLRRISPNCEIIQVDSLTEGAACTTLLAKELIDTDEPLIIANSDQYVEGFDGMHFIRSISHPSLDGGMVTFTASDRKWSFARLHHNGLIAEVAEKRPISNIATVGIYFWSRGSDYVKYAEQMIHENVRVNNEFYVCPVFNEAIEAGKRFVCYHVDKMYGLGTPEDLIKYLGRNDG